MITNQINSNKKIEIKFERLENERGEIEFFLYNL